MTQSNIEIFDRCVASVLAELYVHFPLPQDLIFSDLAMDLWDDDKDGEESYLHKHEVYSQTVNWLEKADFIWLSKMNSYEAWGVVLAPKGLELLKTPSSLDKPSESLGDQIREAMDMGAKGTAANLVKKALTTSITMFSS